VTCALSTTLGARRGFRSRSLFLVLVGSLAACGRGGGSRDFPAVTESSLLPATLIIGLNVPAARSPHPYRPRCTAGVMAGQTVEFRNYAPDRPTNVTSRGGAPAVLYSPDLTWPYNYVGANDPTNEEPCALAGVAGCLSRQAYTYWRYTFERPGVYPWYNTHAPVEVHATVCVPDASGGGCVGLCCGQDADCGSNQTCDVGAGTNGTCVPLPG
jgi:hypothetical protein